MCESGVERVKMRAIAAFGMNVMEHVNSYEQGAIASDQKTYHHSRWSNEKASEV